MSSAKMKNNPELRKDNRSKGVTQKHSQNQNRPASKNSLVRHKEKIEKTGVNKAIMNIEKTKRLIKDMRSEMTEFNQRFGEDTRLKTNHE